MARVAIAPYACQFVVVSFMSELNSVPPASLDEVLTAVKETARGRWFIESFEARLRASECNRLLEAISKLESHVLSVSKNGADAELLIRARAAIAAARKDIVAVEPTIAGLSSEAKLFAQLAEKARNAFNDNPKANQSVSRALQLVVDLDRELSPPPPAIAAPSPTQFFKQDEAIFEPAPKQVLAPRVVAEPVVDTNPRGAKLVIHRIAPPVVPPAQSKVEPEIPVQDPVIEPQLASETILENPAPQASNAIVPEEHAKGRVVIVRRKSEEMIDVPFVDMAGAPSQQSAPAA